MAFLTPNKNFSELKKKITRKNGKEFEGFQIVKKDTGELTVAKKKKEGKRVHPRALCIVEKLDPSTPQKWIVYSRAFDKTKNSYVVKDRSFDKKIDAESHFNDLVKGATRLKTRLLDDYMRIAKQTIRSRFDKGTSHDFSRTESLNDLMFIAVLGLVYQKGFIHERIDEHGNTVTKSYGLGKKGKSKKKGKDLEAKFTYSYNTLERIYGSMSEKIILNYKEEYCDTIVLRNSIQYMVTDYFHAHRASKISTLVSYFWEMMDLVDLGYSLIGRYCAYHRSCVKEAFGEVLSLVRANHLVDRTLEPINLGDNDNYETLLPSDIRHLAFELFEENQGAFDALFLGLTVGGRPGEVYRLIESENPLSMTLGGRGIFLNMNDGSYMTKTYNPANGSGLANPRISILAKVLMENGFNCDEKTFNKSLEAASSRLIEAKKIPKIDGRDYVVPRRIRATTGHLIAKCQLTNKPEHRSSVDTVKERLGHSTILTASESYCRNIPEGPGNVETFFGSEKRPFTGLIIGDKDISLDGPLYDAFLTNLYIEVIAEKASSSAYERVTQDLLREYTRRRPDLHERSLEPKKWKAPKKTGN